ncbi:MAG: DUF4198 domain-containing protein [Acidobacteria bacterium]|nr:DUF4198 domain-containing protein [Acidobacteriota bacterium]
MAHTCSRPTLAGVRTEQPRGRRITTVQAIIAVILLSLPASAHDFWIEPSTFRPALNSDVDLRLRVGEHFKGDAVPRNPAAIETFVVATADRQQHISGRAGGDPAGTFRVTSPGTMLVAYRSRPSTVELTAGEFEQYLKEEGLEHIIASRAARGDSGAPGREQFSRSVKALLHADGIVSGGHDRALGLTLELIPEEDPLTLGRGAMLPVRLLYEGRPLAGALIVALSRASNGSHKHAHPASTHPDAPFQARSDAEGRVQVPLTAGTWLIKTVHMVPAPEGAGVDWQSIWATLTFDVRQAPAGRIAVRQTAGGVQAAVR